MLRFFVFICSSTAKAVFFLALHLCAALKGSPLKYLALYHKEEDAFLFAFDDIRLIFCSNIFAFISSCRSNVQAKSATG